LELIYDIYLISRNLLSPWNPKADEGRVGRGILLFVFLTGSSIVLLPGPFDSKFFFLLSRVVRFEMDLGRMGLSGEGEGAISVEQKRKLMMHRIAFIIRYLDYKKGAVKLQTEWKHISQVSGVEEEGT